MTIVQSFKRWLPRLRVWNFARATDGDDLALDAEFVIGADDDGPISLVLWLPLDPVAPNRKPLHRGLVPQQRNHDLSALGNRLLPTDHNVAVVHVGIDHAVSGDA